MTEVAVPPQPLVITRGDRSAALDGLGTRVIVLPSGEEAEAIAVLGGYGVTVLL